MKNVTSLSDEELHDCFDGTTSAELVREIFEKPSVIKANGTVDADHFAQWFAHSLQDLIDEDPPSEEWQQAWRVNFEWGENIANNINDYIK
jgi:hypothetical protein